MIFNSKVMSSMFVTTLLGSVLLSSIIAGVKSEQLCCQNGCGSSDLNSVQHDLAFNCLAPFPSGDPAISQCQNEASHFVFADSCCADNGGDVDVVHDELFAAPKHNSSVSIDDYDSYLAFVGAGGQLNATTDGLAKRDFNECCGICRTISTASNYCPRNRIGAAISASALICAASCSYIYKMVCTL